MSLQDIIEFDQRLLLCLNGSDSLFWDGVMMTATSTWTWIPAAVVLLYVLFKNNSLSEVLLIIGVIALTVLLADQFSSSFCKPFFKRLRPTQEPALIDLVDMVNGYRGGRYGFISSHAANTFSLFVFIALLIKSRALGWALCAWASFATYTRIYLGVHYPGDILCGMLWGISVGFFTYWLYTRLHAKMGSGRDTYSSQFTPSGYAVSDVNLLLLFLFLSFFYTIIRGMWWVVTL